MGNIDGLFPVKFVKILLSRETIVDIKIHTAEKTDGVILAAGFSSRANSFKMELNHKGKAILHHTIDAMSHCCHRIIVVGGFRIGRIRELTASYPHVQVVLNKDYPSGMFSSVKTGVREVHSQWFFYIPGDYPLVTPDIYLELLNARKVHPETKVLVPVFNERKGHPLLFHGAMKKSILAEPQDSNLRNVIRKEGFTPVNVQSNSILQDIDTPEDYEKIVSKGSKL